MPRREVMAVWASRAKVPAAQASAQTVGIALAERRVVAAAVAWAAKVAQHPRPAAVVVAAQTLGSQEIPVLDQPAAQVAEPLAGTAATEVLWEELTAGNA